MNCADSPKRAPYLAHVASISAPTGVIASLTQPTVSDICYTAVRFIRVSWVTGWSSILLLLLMILFIQMTYSVDSSSSNMN